MEITTIFWFWIAIAALFALAELMTVTFFGLWMAIAAMVPALVVLIAPALSLAEQLLIWGGRHYFVPGSGFAGSALSPRNTLRNRWWGSKGFWLRH